MQLPISDYYYYYYYRKKGFRWRNVKRLQGHLTNAKDSDKTRVRRKVRKSICQMRSWAELSRSGKLRVNSSVFNWRLKDASEDNDVRDLDRLFHVRAAATAKARSPAVERRVGGTTSVDVDEERRRWRAARSDTRSRSQDKYDGARPFRQRKTSTESLNSKRFPTNIVINSNLPPFAPFPSYGRL